MSGAVKFGLIGLTGILMILIEKVAVDLWRSKREAHKEPTPTVEEVQPQQISQWPKPPIGYREVSVIERCYRIPAERRSHFPDAPLLPDGSALASYSDGVRMARDMKKYGVGTCLPEEIFDSVGATRLAVIEATTLTMGHTT